MKTEYISKDQLLDSRELSDHYEYFGDRGWVDIEALVDFVERLPATDVAPVVHGRWETDRECIYWGDSLKRKCCSVCGKRPVFDRDKWEFVLSDYCPNCGAKMDLEVSDERKTGKV